MNTSQDSWLEDVPFEECLALLREGSVGRIAVVPDVDQPPIVVPVNYRLVEPNGLRWVALRTRPGNVIDRAPMNVAFEIDGIDPAQHQGWSVLVRGMLHHVDPDAADFATASTRNRGSWPSGTAGWPSSRFRSLGAVCMPPSESGPSIWVRTCRESDETLGSVRGGGG